MCLEDHGGGIKDVKSYTKRIHQYRMFTIFIEAGAREQCAFRVDTSILPPPLNPPYALWVSFT
jgi:hypothetical protein